MNMPAEIIQYLVFAAVIFSIGLAGLIIRRNVIVIFMCIEMMLNGANITILAYSKLHGDSSFHAAALFVIVLAACEAALGLALVIAVFRYRGTTLADRLDLLKG